MGNKDSGDAFRRAIKGGIGKGKSSNSGAAPDVERRQMAHKWASSPQGPETWTEGEN